MLSLCYTVGKFHMLSNQKSYKPQHVVVTMYPPYYVVVVTCSPF